jgi:hypothetical protein
MPIDHNSKCLSHERDKRHFRHHVQDPRSSQEETRQKSDGRYRSASHDHLGDGDQTSGSARRHPPVPDEARERTENDPVATSHVQESRASIPRSSGAMSNNGTGGAQRSDTKMPQNGVIKISSDDESDESDKLRLGSVWERNWDKFKFKSGADTGMARISRRDWTTSC